MIINHPHKNTRFEHKPPSNIDTKIHIQIFACFRLIYKDINKDRKTTRNKKFNSSPEASQHWKIFGVVVDKFPLKPRTLPDLGTTFSHANHRVISAGFAGFAGFLWKTHRNIRKLKISLREICGNLREFAGILINDI